MIRIRGLRKRLGQKQVLDGVDLDIQSGESIVVMGRSGTGKSVLLKHIVGLMQPDEGSIEIVQGEDMGMRSRLHAEIPAEPGSSIRVSGTARIMRG